MKITEEQQAMYEIAKAEKLLKKYNILEKSQKNKIKDKIKTFSNKK